MTSVSAACEITLRPYAAADRDAVRAIACRTAFRGRGHAALLPDPQLFADYWTRYYTDYESEHIVVAERFDASGARVVGYLFGCRDTARYAAIMARRIIPPVLTRLLQRTARGAYGARGWALIRWMATRSWREAPPVDIATYPAHYHANVLPDGAGHRLYSRMAIAFIDRLEAVGVIRMNGQVTDWQERGTWDRMLSRYQTAHPSTHIIATQNVSTLGRDILGEPRAMVNRAICATTRDFRDMLLWARSTYGL